MIPGGLLNIRDAATDLKLTPRQVHHLIESGKIQAVKTGSGLRAPYLITRDELDRFKAETTEATA